MYMLDLIPLCIGTVYIEDRRMMEIISILLVDEVDFQKSTSLNKHTLLDMLSWARPFE